LRSRQGEFENTKETISQHVHVKNFLQKNDKTSRVTFLRVFVLSCFGVFLGEGVQKHRKKAFQQKVWVFLDKGSSKTAKTYFPKKHSTAVLCWPPTSEEPTNHIEVRHFF
jgi:hypothetical protein